MSYTECVYHRKSKKAVESEARVPNAATNSTPSLPRATSSISVPIVHSLYAKRDANRKHTDDWTSQVRIDMGLPNHLLGYNTTTKSRFEAEVEHKRRNVELMDSFETMNDSVAKLLALLSSETAPGLPQTPDRSHCEGQEFTLANYLDRRCSISEKIAKIKP